MTPFRPRTRRLAIAAIVIAAGALRLWRIDHGLPDFVEEAIPFKKAFEMWGWDAHAADLNPHLFHYPSLSFYLHLAVQKLHFATGLLLGRFQSAGDYFVAYHIDPTPMVVLARLVGVLADAAIVLAVAAIGERARAGAGLLGAALVALSPTMILDSRSIYTDGAMAALAIWALERMLAYREQGGTSRLVAAVILIGLAAGTKYPAGLLVIPLAWVIFERSGLRGIRTWVIAALGSFAVFLLTSPYVLLDFGTFRRDFSDVGRLAAAGHLGSLEHSRFLHYVGSLARDPGWVALALLVVSLGFAIARAGREKVAIGLWLFLLVFGTPISVGRVEAERYLIPVLPAVAALAAIALFRLAERWAGRARPVAITVLVLAALLPLGVSGVRAAAAGGDTTQLAARRWLEAHLSERELLLQEAYGAELPTRSEIESLARVRAFQSARPELRQAYLARRAYRSVAIPLAVAGRIVVRVRSDHGAEFPVEVFRHVVDSNRFFYHPSLYLGADYVLTSGAVRGRYEADSQRFTVQNRFYRLLDETASRVAVFRAEAGVTGSEIRVYRLTSETKDAIRSRYGSLDPLWWAEDVPMAYRLRIDALTQGSAGSQGAARGADGAPAAWVRSLEPVFAERIRPFANALSVHLSELERFSEAREPATAILEMLPGDLRACAIFTLCAARLEQWGEAKRALENLIRLRDPEGREMPVLRLDYARVLARAGDHDAARRELERLLTVVDPRSALARSARDELAGLNRGGASR